jgi:hypothetical protein
MDVDTCRQLIEELLSSYVDGELDNATAQSLELHLQMCPPCAAFFRTFKATKRCVRAQAIAEMPADCEQSLWSFLESELGDDVGGERADAKTDPNVIHATCSSCGPHGGKPSHGSKPSRGSEPSHGNKTPQGKKKDPPGG